MMVFSYILVILLNIGCCFRKKNSRSIVILTVGYIMLCVAGSVDNADYYNYHEWYLGNWHPPTVEKGYLFLSDLFSKFGVPYWGFLAVTQLFILGILLWIAHLYSKEYHIILVLYMSYQIFIDYVQRRNALALAIFVLAVLFLANGKKIAYIFCIIIAFLIHKSMIIFLPFVILSSNSKFSKKTVRLFTIILSIACVFLFVNGNKLPFLKQLSQIASHYTIMEGKFDRYMNSKTRFGFVYPFWTYFINLLLAYISKNIVESQSIIEKGMEKIVSFVNMAYYFVCISAFALPLVMINEEFIRYFRCGNVLLYLMVSIVVMICKKYKPSKLKILKKVKADYFTYYLIVIINIVSWVVVYTPNNVVSMLFKTNIWLT